MATVRRVSDIFVQLRTQDRHARDRHIDELGSGHRMRGMKKPRNSGCIRNRFRAEVVSAGVSHKEVPREKWAKLRPVSASPLAKCGTVVVVMQRLAASTCPRPARAPRHRRRPGEAQIDAAAVTARSAGSRARLMLEKFSNRIIANRLGPAKPRDATRKGAGGCVIASHS